MAPQAMLLMIFTIVVIMFIMEHVRFMRKFKTVVIDYDDSLSGDRIELTYNLGKKTMKYRDNGNHIYMFEKNN